MLVMNVSLGSFFYGYNMSLINSLDMTINDYYFNINYNTDGHHSLFLLNSSYPVSAIFGSFIVFIGLNYDLLIGRRKLLLYCDLIALISISI